MTARIELPTGLTMEGVAEGDVTTDRVTEEVGVRVGVDKALMLDV